MALEHSHIILERRKDVTVILINVRELYSPDLVTDLRNLLTRVIEQLDRPLVVLDMKNVEGMGSVFMGALNVVRKAAVERDGDVHLAAMQPQVEQSVRIAAMTSVFKVTDTIETAINRIRNPVDLEDEDASEF